MSTAVAELRKLAGEFWTWREVTQPDCYDDLNRVERPDDWLPDWSPEAVAGRIRALAGFARRHRALDLSAEPVPVRVDAELVGSAIARVHWELHLLRDWQRNPGFYLDQALLPVYHHLLRPSATDESRSRTVAARLARVPEVLAQGKHNLAGHAAAPLAEYALRLLDTAEEALGTAMAALARPLPLRPAAELDAATAAARQGLADYRQWLRARLPTFTEAFAPGREAFGYFLHRVALLPYSVDQLRDLGRREYARAAAAELVLGRHGEAPSPPLLAGTAAQISRQRADEQDVRAFLRKEGVIGLPDDLRHYRNAPLPDYLEPLTWLGVQHHTASADGWREDALRYIPEPRPDLPYFQLAEARDPRVGIVHEGVHAWQLALSGRHENQLRRHYYDSAANEGVAFHMEELTLTAGLFDGAPASQRFIVNAMRLRALRVEIDLGLALGELTLDEAAGRLADLVPMDHRTAWEETAFYASRPGLGLGYLAGKAQVLDLLTASAQREGAAFSLSAFHDRLWREGNVPLALQRWEVLGTRDHLDEARRLGG
ncbi:DUF885 family protein [Kitasatospora brasiliensis]|uniref:DUF885 family protein n=1 Tax=Kitasatospora brasiliensis TaxID=3058040 RepID=UPI0029310D69|nr:DUF885 family protein [Kitasatospora sp. K002]